MFSKERLIKESNKERSKCFVPSRNVEIVESSLKDIEKIIFAPDPNTGLPCSDLALTEQQFREPAVQAYVAKYLSRERVGDPGFDDVNPDEIPSRRLQFGAERDKLLAGLRDVVNNSVSESK